MAGARFFKSDLQMQTPVDRVNWTGPESLSGASTSEDRQKVADAYIRRCYDLKLEVIGVTEHNLAPADCPSLMPELAHAIARIGPEFGYGITMFPGFEVAVTIGSGIHVLCLFEPGTPVQTLSEKLTRLGLEVDARFVDRVPQPVPVNEGLTLNRLLQVVQEDPVVPGILILAHMASSSGAMDRDKIAQWWSAGVIKDDRVLCGELPRPRADYADAPNESLLKSVLNNSDTRYKRSHPIATICSSDCKSLVPSSVDATNFIGYRHTWIKMGSPSIEGLRQAFLDFDSRIKFGDRHPADSYTYPQIESVRISGAAFLSDQTLDLSPNLNVIIGGSGTGKSTILNYMRMCLGQGGAIRGEDVKANYDRTLSTIRPTTEIAIGARFEESEIQVSSRGRQIGALTSEDQSLSGLQPRDLFPVRFFGQREIYAIAEDRAAAISLLDDLHEEALAGLSRQVAEASQRYNASAADALHLTTLESELAQVTAQKAKTQAALDSVQAAAAPLATLAVAQDRVRFVDSLHVASATAGEGLRAVLGSAVAAMESPPTPDDGRLRDVRTTYINALETLVETVMRGVEDFGTAIESLASAESVVAVRQERDAAQAAVAAIQSELLAQGIETASFEQYREAVEALTLEQASLTDRIRASEEAAERMVLVQGELVALWKQELTLRRQSTQALNEAVPRTESGEPFVEVTLHPYGNDGQFRELLAEFRGDRRKISDDDWESLCLAILAASRGTETPPNHLLADWVAQLESGTVPDGFPFTDVRLYARVVECFPRSSRADLCTRRVSDRAQVELRRLDGTVAGDIEGGLSVGQKCTAILALLLALDTTPAVIDQPEDEIDNEFTYREMVPLLRRVKERRQLIVVTHDPNIPVNGDAELIYALAAVDGRGQVKKVGGVPAVGSLDQDHVRAAVEEIMEGSEDAFRRRYVKYGF